MNTTVSTPSTEAAGAVSDAGVTAQGAASEPVEQAVQAPA